MVEITVAEVRHQQTDELTSSQTTRLNPSVVAVVTEGDIRAFCYKCHWSDMVTVRCIPFGKTEQVRRVGDRYCPWTVADGKNGSMKEDGFHPDGGRR